MSSHSDLGELPKGSLLLAVYKAGFNSIKEGESKGHIYKVISDEGTQYEYFTESELNSSKEKGKQVVKMPFEEIKKEFFSQDSSF